MAGYAGKHHIIQKKKPHYDVENVFFIDISLRQATIREVYRDHFREK
jgi:hypothetical protein